MEDWIGLGAGVTEGTGEDDGLTPMTDLAKFPIFCVTVRLVGEDDTLLLLSMLGEDLVKKYTTAPLIKRAKITRTIISNRLKECRGKGRGVTDSTMEGSSCLLWSWTDSGWAIGMSLMRVNCITVDEINNVASK